MEETHSEIFLRTCTKHEDIGSNLQIYFDLAFVLNSLFITRQQLHRITSSALTTEYLMKPAGIISTMLFINNLIYIRSNWQQTHSNKKSVEQKKHLLDNHKFSRRHDFNFNISIVKLQSSSGFFLIK